MSLCDQALVKIEKELFNKSAKECQENSAKKSILSNQLILNELIRFKHRPSFVEKCLLKLYGFTHTYHELRIDLTYLLLVLMRKYHQIIEIQMAATACLFELTKYELGEEIDRKLAEEIIEALLLVKKTFPNDPRLQKNILSILCNDDMLPFLDLDKLNLFDSILALMRKHSNLNTLQLTCISSLNSLIVGRSKRKIEISKLQNIYEVTNAAIKLFPNYIKLQMSGLLLLCSDRILQSVSMDLNYLIDSIMKLIENNLNLIDIQVNATQCLRRLVRNHLVGRVEPDILKKIIDNTLISMELYPNEIKLQSNSLAILCSDLILQDIPFDKCKCIQSALDSLINFKDKEMNQKAVLICLLSNDLSNAEKLNVLLNPIYRKTLLDIVRDCIRLSLDPNIYLEPVLCVFWNLTHELANEISIKIIEEVVDVTIKAFETFPNHQQIVLNALKILCGYRILENVPFDRYKCTQLVMKTLVQFKDKDLVYIAVEICSILSSHITMNEKSNIGSNPTYMETLLNIIRNSVQSAPDYDIILLYTLSFLWNLSDLSPETCELFSRKGGLDLCFLILNVSFHSIVNLVSFFYPN